MGQPRAEPVLVVDDEAGVRELLARWLASGGYHVQTAGDADEALRLLRLGLTRQCMMPMDSVLTNAGIDNNVFNEPDSEGPKRDFTMTVTPAADMWLRLGPSWLRGHIKEDLLYFQTYSSQNSANTSFSVNWVMPFNRLTINPGLAYLNTNDRPGFEIDTRAPRVEVDYNGMLEYRLGSKTFVGARIDNRDFL